LLLAAVFLAGAMLITPLLFPAAPELHFCGSAHALCSRHHHRDPLISAGISHVKYIVFDKMLCVHLPGGPLRGVGRPMESLNSLSDGVGTALTPGHLLWAARGGRLGPAIGVL
ncbi:hypothetical protein PUR49_00220, partial [Streptomyces sp. BE147]|nr:hypothetical protein [Streptomyces sp. BE147]